MRSLPDEVDIYSLRIGGSLNPVALAASAHPAEAPGVHPESLLAWSAQKPPTRSGFGARPASPGTPTQNEVRDALKDMEEALRSLFAELDQTSMRITPQVAGAPKSVSDDELMVAIETFADASRGAGLEPAPRRGISSRDITAASPFLSHLPGGVRHLFRTAADFVTPGDLSKTDSLRFLGL